MVLEDRWIPEPTSGCWLWIGALSKCGYGLVRVIRNGKQSSTTAHRFVYEKYRGLVPAGMELDHLCRNRACVNPDHVQPVSGAVNVHRGANAKLTDKMVEEIRVLATRGRGRRSGGPTQKELAARYGVSPAAIAHAATRRNWKVL
jgi:hypothetical protein